MPNREKRIENLQRANEESHRLIVDCLRHALYKLLEEKDIGQIKVIDLTKAAGVSRGGFYRNFYLVTDVLLDDIQTVADDIRKALGSDAGLNWRIILRTVYKHRKKIPLLIKAGLGMEILNKINQTIDAVNDDFKLRIMAWNGVIFNCIIYWAENDFSQDPDQLADHLTEITKSILYD